MKKIISSLSFILFVGIAMVSAQNADRVKAAQPTDKKVTAADQKANSQVQVYYFHATRRCATCQAVESVTEKTIKENYGEKVSFESINNEEDKDNPLIEKYEISGQTLLVIKGDQKADLTNEAFLNARTSPAKFEKKLKAAIDKLL
ncbi:MAG TPA: nitrophenyl compound nitroreductase subunit ArsF family protein [Bacteroidales bacterium]|nr:nitrophenyl compound nitroreductase subunit ArsF family protein [Bacteroidales bacterium]